MTAKTREGEFIIVVTVMRVLKEEGKAKENSIWFEP